MTRALAVCPDLLLLLFDELIAGLDGQHLQITRAELEGFRGALVVASPHGDLLQRGRAVALTTERLHPLLPNQ